MPASLSGRARRWPWRAPALAAVIALASASCGGAAPLFPAPPPASPGTGLVLGPVTGTGSRTFTVAPHPGLSFSLGCVGGDIVWLRVAHPHTRMIAFAVTCRPGQFGGDAITLKKSDFASRILVRVSAHSGTTWWLRVDGSPWSAATPGMG